MYPTWVGVGAGAEAPCLPVSPQRQRCNTQGSFVSRVDGLDTQAQLSSGSEWRKTSLLSPRVVPPGHRGPTVLLSLPPLTPWVTRVRPSQGGTRGAAEAQCGHRLQIWGVSSGIPSLLLVTIHSTAGQYLGHVPCLWWALQTL